MNTLQTALLGNAIFSLLSALFLLLFRKRVAKWFGKKKSLVFLIIGLCLLYFSYSIFREIQKPEPVAVFFIIVQDIIWVFCSILILLIKPFQLTALGHKILAGVALIVLLFGAVQAFGLAEIDSVRDKGIKRLSFNRIVNASKENTWKTISDVANYHKVAPNIDSVTIISGKGKGMVRSCTHKTENWTEIATLWEEGEQYSFEVNTEAEDYPYPLNYLKGTWKVEEISNNETRIIMEFDFSYKRNIHNLVIHPFMKSQFNKISQELLDNWQDALEAK